MNHPDCSHAGKAKWTNCVAAVHWDLDASSVSCVSLGGVDHMTRELNKIYRGRVYYMVMSLGDEDDHDARVTAT